MLGKFSDDEMFAVNVSANHRYIRHICMHHRLPTILTYLQYMSYYIHITCLVPEFSIKYIICFGGEDVVELQAVKSCRASSHSLRLRFNIFKCDTHG